ncbi:MAG: DUF2243 domain-containing protein [Kineosporiaceae bacterium]
MTARLDSPAPSRAPAPLRAPGVVLGVGLGAFVDGIVLHQLLGWHHMVSNAGHDRLGLHPRPVTTVGGLEANTVADGAFHVGAWVLTVVGVVLLARRRAALAATARPGRVLAGWALVGWGAFDLVEGLVDHQLLAVHHMRQGLSEAATLAWDLGFLAFGAVLVAAGLLLARSAGPTRRDPGEAP